MADISAGMPPSATPVSDNAEMIKTSLRAGITAPPRDEIKGQLQGKDTFSLRVGTTVTVTVVRGEDGGFILRISGRDFPCTLPAELAKTGTFSAKVMSESPLLLMPENYATDIRRSELLALAGKDIATIAKEMAAMKLSVISAGELQRIIRNCGLFLENKLAKDIPVSGDTKLKAGIQGNQTVWDGISRMQLASAFLEDGIFSFFEMDELEDYAVIRVRREKYGAALYMKMMFSRLGSAVLSIVPSNTGKYTATVRTERDISDLLSKAEIAGATVRWQRLRKNDIEIFDIRSEIIKKQGKFDIII
ncbi:MAG: hypothetical protein LBH05_06850 [Deferribacteraceae bacterium]|jgi:uncharacterized protein|nr:hypothetical protein [Deferribacteraceae bacterium]